MLRGGILTGGCWGPCCHERFNVVMAENWGFALKEVSFPAREVFSKNKSTRFWYSVLTPSCSVTLHLRLMWQQGLPRASTNPNPEPWTLDPSASRAMRKKLLGIL